MLGLSRTIFRRRTALLDIGSLSLREQTSRFRSSILKELLIKQVYKKKKTSTGTNTAGGSHVINVCFIQLTTMGSQVAIQLVASHDKNRRKKIQPCESHWLIKVHFNHFSGVLDE